MGISDGKLEVNKSYIPRSSTPLNEVDLPPIFALSFTAMAMRQKEGF